MIRFLQTPGRTQKALLVGFLAIICIMMVITLVPGNVLGDLTGRGSENAIAKVGSQEVTIQDVQRQAQNMARQQFPRGVPSQVLPFFYQQAANGLITQNVFLAEAHRLGLDATGAEVRDALQHGPISTQLFPGGQFVGQEAYSNFVQQNFNMTVPQFEEMVKKQLTMSKLREMIEGSVTVSSKDVQEHWVRQNTKVKLNYAVLSLDTLAKGINPSDAELRAYYEKNQKQLENSIPEERKARYIVIDPAKLPGAQPTDQDIEAYYKNNQEQFRVREAVTARHILIATGNPGGTPDQKTVDAAKAKAEDVLKQLKGGANFADLAKKYSDDPGSKEKGGDLGQIVRGQTVPEFEKAAFGAKKGETVGPVQSQFGFHIIQVQDKTDAHVKPLNEVRAQIEPIVARQKAQGTAEQLARTVETQARTAGLDKAASDKGLQVVTTDFFKRGDSLPGIGPAPAFMDYAFGQKPMSPPSMIATPTGYVVAQTTESKAARTPTFEEAKAQLSEQFRRERAQAMLQQKAQELADKAKSMHDLKAAAQQVGATYKTSELVTPDQQVPELGVVGQVMDPGMKNGEIAGPVPANGSAAVIQLAERQEPAMAEFDKAKDSVRESLLQQKKGQVLEVYVASLREKMEKGGKVKIYQERMKQMTQTTGE